MKSPVTLPDFSTYPRVSVLIAARNEETTILSCLKAVAGLSYPPELIDVWIGNDASEDNTREVVQNFIRDKPQFHLVDITDNLGRARGKANVLAHLARSARGEFFFITDADVQVPPQWIESILVAWQPGIGVITGVTSVEGTRLFHHLQAVDWIQGLGMIKAVSDRNIPVTTTGNNMMVTREAYQATGGYEQLPFSITEDFALFRAIISGGYGFKNLLTSDVLAFTGPVNTLREWLQQRKRWMHGAMQLPWYLVFALMAQALLFPALLVGLFFYPVAVLLIWAGKTGVQSVIIRQMLRKLQQPHLVKYLPLFELYNSLLSMLLVVYYFMPLPVRWKGRKYP
jgi:cellulose synthase/poly-beta-1,6-N-acetylglucosamine synthase-like glycosyltransferase